MVNQTSSIVAALLTEARLVSAKLNEAYIIHQIFDTETTKLVYRELYAQDIDAWTAYWRACPDGQYPVAP